MSAMSKQQRQNAPEAPKAPGAAEKPPEPAKVDAPVLDAPQNAPEAPKAPGADAAAADSDRAGAEEEFECPACVAFKGERPCSLACFVAAGYPAEQYEQMFGKQAPPALVDPSRNGRPPPDGSVIVRALVGCVVRVQHRYPGDIFWMLKTRPDDGGHELGEYADDFQARGEVEILKS